MNLGLLNARSAVNKASLIHDVIADHRLDIAVITESWITSDAPNAVKYDIAPTGYRVIHAHRGTSLDGRGGGLAIIYRDTIELSIVNIGQFGEFESLFVRLNSKHSPVIIACIYRPPGSVTNVFCDEFSDVLEQLMSRKRYVICGDINWKD
jgi:exonuclease III